MRIRHIQPPSTMPSSCDKPTEPSFFGTPANLAAFFLTRERTPPSGGATCHPRFIPMPLSLNWSGMFCSGESGLSSRLSCSCRNSFPELGTGWWMKFSGGHVSTPPNGQATYPLQNKRYFGNKPVSLRTEPLKRSEHEEEIHRKTGCFTFAGRMVGNVLGQAKRSFGKPWPVEPLAGARLYNAFQKDNFFLRFRPRVRHLS